MRHPTFSINRLTAACLAWIAPISTLVLGREQQLRLRIQGTLLAMTVYALSLLAQWHSVSLGWANPEAARWLGIVAIALAYQVNPITRGVLPMLVGLVLIFGSFTRTPQACRRLSVFAVVAFGASITVAVWRQPQDFPLLVEIHPFIFITVVLLTTGMLAGQLSRLRADWKRQTLDRQQALLRLDQGRQEMAEARAAAKAANALADDREACLAAGMDGDLAKPVTFAKLAEVVAELMPAQALPPPTQSSRHIFDPSVLAALPKVADGSQPEFAQELLKLFESELTTALTEIEAALTKDDGAKLLRCLHTLKSSSAQVGAVELATVTGTFENLQRAGQSPSPTWLSDIQAAASRLQQAQHEGAHRGTEKAI